MAIIYIPNFSVGYKQEMTKQNFTVSKEVMVGENVYPAKQYEFSVNVMVLPHLNIEIDGHSMIIERVSNAENVQCYSKPSRITGYFSCHRGLGPIFQKDMPDFFLVKKIQQNK